MATGTRVGAEPSAQDEAAGEDAGGADDPAGPDRSPARPLALAAIVAAVVPILIAGFRGALRGWTPTGDNAYSAVRGWDLFTGNPPLLGTWSSASLYGGHEVNHPGPLHFDLLAVPVRLLGHGPGTAIGLALVNATAVALIAWLVARRAGWEVAALAMGASALLSWSLGSEMLYDPWSQHSPLIPFSLFLVTVWCVLAGDLVALPVMVVAGSLAFQTHLSYTILVPGLALLAVGVTVVRLVRDRADPDTRRVGIRWGLVTLATALICWAQPIYQQVTADGEGNMLGLWRSAGTDAPTPGMGKAIRAFGGTVAVPPAWLPPSFGSPSFDLSGGGRPTWLAGLALVLLVAAMSVLGWRAHRRGSTVIAAAAATGLALLALGFLTTLRMPIRHGMVATYSRFMWPLGMVVWLTLAAALLDEARLRWSLTPRRLALPGLVLAVVAGLATLPTVDNESATFPWTVDAIHAMDDDVLAAVEDNGGGPVLVELPTHFTVGSVGPALFSVLQDAGIPFYVNDQHLVSQLGTDRRFEPGRARLRLVVKGGIGAEAAPGEEQIAHWEPLTSAEEAELDRLSAELRDIVAEHGIPLTAYGRRVLDQLGMDGLKTDVAEARTDPDRMVDNDTLRELWSGIPAQYENSRVLDPEVFPDELMDRWADLAERHEVQPVSVYLSPAPA